MKLTELGLKKRLFQSRRINKSIYEFLGISALVELDPRCADPQRLSEGHSGRNAQLRRSWKNERLALHLGS